MNERFQQILKQSTNPPWDGEQGPMNEFNLEKFAELIVKECAEFVSNDRQNDDYGVFVSNRIKQHFGVEE